MIRTASRIRVCLATLALAVGLLYQAVTAAAPLGGDFVLESSDGTVSLTELRGKVVPLYFGYMSCPDICPITLSVLGAALASLDDAERNQVQALFVSLDPQRDSPEQLAAYAQHFHPTIIGLTGSADTVAEVANRYRVRFAMVPSSSNGSYTLDHTSRLVLIDRQGQMRQLIPDGSPPEQVAAAIRSVLAQ